MPLFLSRYNYFSTFYNETGLIDLFSNEYILILIKTISLESIIYSL